MPVRREVAPGRTRVIRFTVVTGGSAAQRARTSTCSSPSWTAALAAPAGRGRHLHLGQEAVGSAGRRPRTTGQDLLHRRARPAALRERAPPAQDEEAAAPLGDEVGDHLELVVA